MEFLGHSVDFTSNLGEIVNSFLRFGANNLNSHQQCLTVLGIIICANLYLLLVVVVYPIAVFFFFKDFIHLFMRERERGRNTGRGRSRLPTGCLLYTSDAADDVSWV